MAIRKFFGALVGVGLVSVIAAGCSSSNGTTGDGGADDSGVIHKTLDAGIGTGTGDDADSGSGSYDGTTGKQCTSDSDCVSDAGPGINICSVDVGFTITNAAVSLWATPVCILPPPQTQGAGNCDPAPQGDDGLPHFCDGPDLPTSPGLCVPFDPTNPQPDQGVCYPLCTFALDGTKPTGCVGTDSCFPVTFLRSSTTGAVTGYGFCGGGCQQDSDCTPLGAGYVCQTDIGYCTQKAVVRSKPIGAACSNGTTAGTTDDSTLGNCNCDADPTSGLGYCSSSCIVGGLACPDGWICDAGYPNPLVFTASGSAPIEVPVPAQNVGIPGVCQPACALADAGVVDAGPVADAGSDAAVVGDGGSAACPPNSSCSGENLAGPDCVP